MSAFTLLPHHRERDLVALPARPSTGAGEEPWDRHTFLRAVAAVAAQLPRAGSAEAEGNDQLVLICRDRLRFAAGLLAAWERGYRVALPPNPQPQTVRAIRERPGVYTVLHDVGAESGAGAESAEEIRGLDLFVLELGDHEPLVLSPIEDSRELVTVYTSGSTGAHVACAKTAGQLLGEAELLVSTFGVEAGARVLATVPAHHIYGLLFSVLMPMAAGAAFLRETRLFPAAIAEQARLARADVLVSVPAHLRALRSLEATEEGEGGASPFPPMRHVFSSSAPLPPGTARFVAERFGWTVTEVFGSTETGGIGHRQSGGEGPWTAFEGVRVEVGEGDLLLLDSPFLRPEEPRPYLAADRVKKLDARRFAHLGRSDGVVKVAGVRVSLAEVEQKLLAIEGVTDAAALAVEVGGPRGQVIWAAYASDRVAPEEARAALLGWLSPVAMPRRFLRVPSAPGLPRSEHGKLPRAALLALFGRPREDGEEP